MTPDEQKMMLTMAEFATETLPPGTDFFMVVHTPGEMTSRVISSLKTQKAVLALLKSLVLDIERDGMSDPSVTLTEGLQ